MPLYQGGEGAEAAAKAAGPIWRVHEAFDRLFEKMRDAYHRLLDRVLEHRALVGGGFALFAFASLGLVLFVGKDFFPYVDSGQMRLHVRCPSGTRIEEVERIFGQVEEEVRRIVPPRSSIQSLTTSGCRTQASISLSAIAPPMDPETGKFSSHSSPSTIRRSATPGNSGPAWLPNSLRTSSSFRRRTSRVRF